jgi:hypothetical protein
MSLRLLLLTFVCAGALLMSPAERTAPLSVSASVVWGACTSWTWSHRGPPLTGLRATPLAHDRSLRAGRARRE